MCCVSIDASTFYGEKHRRIIFIVAASASSGG